MRERLARLEAGQAEHVAADARSAAHLIDLEIERDAAVARGDRLQGAHDEIHALYDRLRVDAEQGRLQREALVSRNEELQALSDHAEAVSKLKSDVIANMSHELRTPMNSIIGFTDLVLNSRRANIDTRTRRHLEVVRRNARHLLQLINGILDLAKIEAGKLSVYPEPLDLPTLVRSMVAVIEPMISEKGLALTVDVPADLGTIVTDETKLRQILLNLLANAVKFTARGGVAVVARRAGAGFEVRVTDTGIGIAPHDQARIFEEFVQLDAGPGQPGGGSGLGLAIARKMTELLGGSLALESDPGRGSTFSLVLPASYQQAELEALVAPASPSAAVPLDPGGRLTVVVIDDDPDLLLLVAEKLRDSAYMVVPASSGESGLGLVRTLRPHAVLLDVLMPNMDGWSVLRELKRDRATADIPVVVLSVVENKVVGFALGASAYLTKPFEQEELVATLERLAPARPGSATVLVADDNPDDRELARQLIEEAGGRVVEAADGVEALAAIARERPALVLLDLTMPRMDGFAVIASMRADASMRDIPVVVVTARELSVEERASLDQVRMIVPKGQLTETFVIDDIQHLLDMVLGRPAGAPHDA